jgi:hypothetical protein
MTNNLKDETDKILEFIPQPTPGMECYDLNHKFMKCNLCGNSPRAKAKHALQTLINQKEKELLEKVEECIPSKLSDDPYTYDNRKQFECAVVHNKLVEEIEDRIKQLKEELKGGKD